MNNDNIVVNLKTHRNTSVKPPAEDVLNLLDNFHAFFETHLLLVRPIFLILYHKTLVANTNIGIMLPPVAESV